jgi:hypothetical protein
MRRPDWPERLAAYIEACRRKPFAWGRFDCCGFVAGGVKALTGRDPMAAWRGLYTTEAEALALLGVGGLAAAVAEGMAGIGAQEVPVPLAQRGDVVVLELPAGSSAGLCDGSHAFAAGPAGLTRLPMSLAVRAWGY